MTSLDMHSLNRRSFLITGTAGALAIAAAACSSGDKPASPGGDAKTLGDLTKGKSNTLEPAVVQPLLNRPNDRLALGLLQGAGPDKGKPIKGGTAIAYLATSQTEPFIKAPLEYVGDGFEFGVYVARISLPKPGEWLLYVEATPEGATKALSGGTRARTGEVPSAPGGKPQPIPGDKAISIPTPTPTQPRGVKPICTRKPACSMHALSLDQALKNGKPTVLTIGTPAFCQTRFCGPLIDQLMLVQKQKSAQINFVHIELHPDDTNAPAKLILSPGAKAWRVEAEPVTYYIAKNSTIIDWTIGASDAREMTTIATTLLS